MFKRLKKIQKAKQATEYVEKFNGFNFWFPITGFTTLKHKKMNFCLNLIYLRRPSQRFNFFYALQLRLCTQRVKCWNLCGTLFANY